MSGFKDRKTKLIFTASIVCNVLLIGVIGGHVYKNMQDQPWHELREEITPETRDLLKATFQEKRERIFNLMREFDNKKKTLEQIFTAPEFDGVAFEAAAKDFIAFNNEVSESKLQTFLGLGQKLPQHDRQVLAKKFVGVLTGTPPERRHKKEDGDDHRPDHHKDGALPSPPPPPEAEGVLPESPSSESAE